MNFNPAVFSIRNRLFTNILILLVVAAGVLAYQSIARFEDPQFTIRQAIVGTPYPGATPMEVATEVTERLEREISQMQEVKEIISTSQAGSSRIEVEIKYEFSRNQDELDGVWTDLRNRVSDAQALLPPGAGPSLVNDDFGDVFGLFYFVTGDGYSPAELFDYAKQLRTDLSAVEGVGKVVLSGERPETFYIEISRERIAQIGVSVQHIYESLSEQNLVEAAGSARVGPLRLEINPTGAISSVQELRDIPVSTSQGGIVVRLGEIATVERGYADPPAQLLRYDGRPAIGLGISNATGTNVVKIGELVDRRLQETLDERPVGIDIHEFYHQGNVVSESINAFLVNVVTALAIVLVVLWLAMGWRPGAIIGAVLLLTVAATLGVMYFQGIPMHRISLGALIIALGMMVDNAIVIVEGMLKNIRRGQGRLDAARSIARQMIWPLLGGTAIGIIAFAPIGLAPGQVAEFMRDLFLVVMIALLASWIFALTVAPYLANLLFRQEAEDDAAADAGEGADTSETGDASAGHAGPPGSLEGPAGGEQPGGARSFAGRAREWYRALLARLPGRSKRGDESAGPSGKGLEAWYRRQLETALHHKKLVAAATAGIFLLSVLGFSFVQQGFFPASTTPHILIDYRLPAGSAIERTSEDLERMERRLARIADVEGIQTVIGSGTLRYKLTYVPEPPKPWFGQVILKLKDASNLATLAADLQRELTREFPLARIKVWVFKLGPGGQSAVEAEYSGPDPEVLPLLAEKAKSVLADDRHAIMVKDDWGQAVPVIVPLYAEARARRLGVSKQAVAQALQANFTGTRIGVFREGDDLIPIVARAPQGETANATNLETVPVFSDSGQTVPLAEVVDGIDTRWRHAILKRVDQRWTINAQADPGPQDTASKLLERVRPRVEELPVPRGYQLAWEGEYGDQQEATSSLVTALPFAGLAMLLTLIALFNALRQPAVILMIVPLAIIGVTIGLLLLQVPLEFVGILGVLSLSGLLIKNAIVIVDQIDIEIADGGDRFRAVIDGAADRAPPVVLASLTTVLGVVPLYFDAFFKSMAVVLAFGLTFGTILTLIVVPVLYAMVFGIEDGESGADPDRRRGAGA